MIYEIRFLKEALNNIDSIADYTLRDWGENQMNSYLDGLFLVIESLKKTPETKGLDRSYLHPNLRSVMYESHYYIFYRINLRHVEITRVLHTKSNWLKCR